MNRSVTHSYSYLDQLSPVEVFQLLAKAAKSLQGRCLDRVRIVFIGAAPFKFVTLEVPDPQADKQWEDEAEPGVYANLVEAFKEMTGRRERYKSPGGDSKALLEGIAWLLLKSANEADEALAGTKGGEYLVVSQSMDAKAAEHIFKNLSFHATSTRVSTVEDSQGGSRYLFYLKDDPRRKSSFAAIAAAGFFEDHSCRVLTGYESEEQVTFLPADVQPGERKLYAFGRLLEAAPLLFGIKEGKKVTGPVAAVVQWPTVKEAAGKTEAEPEAEIRLELLYLGELRFFKQELLTGRKVSRARFEYLHLQESKRALDGLAEEIRTAGAGVGYRLELRPTQYLEKNRLERLLDQKARLEHNIAYLQSITVPQPVLLRYTHEQLPALAAWVRSFPMHVLHDGRLKYGFQATEEEPVGNHFILIDLRETPGGRLEPPLSWQEQGMDTSHVRFRLDPFWASHYFEAGGDSLVFVPPGSALFPPIHDWERGNMDGFLRETMAHWFQDRLKGQVIPGKPIYVFEGEPGTNQPIQISILDQEHMEPLHIKLGWLNDNLLLHHTLEKEDVIMKMAKDITWSELTQKLKSEAEKSRNDFSETAREVSLQMAQTTGEMTRLLTNEIDRVVKETFRMTQKIKNMNHRLNEWDKVLSDMDEVLQEVHRQKQEVSFQEGTTRNEFWRLEQQILREVQASERRRKELEEKIAEEIVKLQTTTRNLKQRLKRVKL